MQSYFLPKYNIALVNGNSCLQEASICFLNHIHDLDIDVKTSKPISLRKIFHSCINNSLAQDLSNCIAECSNSQLYKVIFTFCLSSFSYTEIYSVFSEKTLTRDIKKLISKLNKQEISILFVNLTENIYPSNLENTATLTENIPGIVLDHLSIIKSSYL